MPTTFKIATFNVNSIRTRLNAVLDWLREYQPDALCLQETKVQDADFPVAPFLQAGWQTTFRGEKSYNGVALISKIKPTEVNFGFDDGQESDATRLLSARLGDLHIVNAYVPQGREIDHPMYQYKLNWFRRLRDWFDHHFTPQSSLVWVGDLNVAPEAQDIHNAEKQTLHVCYHVDVRETFATVMDWGFTDVFRKHQPGPGQFSFFDYRTPNAAQRKMGWRIDHILATAPLAAKSVAAGIDLGPRLRPAPSDHTPMWADFAL